MKPHNHPQSASEQRGASYVELFRTVYRLVPASAPVLTTGILQALFISLQDDVLAFLAGIWTGAVQAIDEDSEIRTVALCHAAAFLQAHIAEGGGVDFQTILPSLLVALQSRDSDRRKIALTCISHLHLLSDWKFVTLYGFDTIYGKSTSELYFFSCYSKNHPFFPKFNSNISIKMTSRDISGDLWNTRITLSMMLNTSTYSTNNI